MTNATPMIYEGGQWRPAQISVPVEHIHREDSIPYAMPTAAPWNPPVSCRIPTYDGSNKTTHPSVVDFHHEFGPGGKFRGYRYWMAHTPYPNDNVLLENPSIVASNNGWDWHDPYGITNPVVAQPEPDTYYNADSDLAWNPEMGRLEMIWKHQSLANAADTYYRHSFSYNGVDWSESTIIRAVEGSTAPGWGWLSPGMSRVGPHDWRIVFLRPVGANRLLTTFTATTPAGPWEGPVDGQVIDSPFIEGESLWHPDVVFDGESWWMATSSRTTGGAAEQRAWIYPARSTDGVDWVFGPAILKDEPGSPDSFKYRPTLALHENGTHMRVWYGERGTMTVRYTEIPLSEWPTLPA